MMGESEWAWDAGVVVTIDADNVVGAGIGLEVGVRKQKGRRFRFGLARAG